MKYFLISPDYPDKHRLLAPVPPLGIALVAAVIEKLGHEVRCEDQFGSCISNDKLVDKILDFGADVIGIGSLTPSITNAIDIVKLARSRGFKGTVMMGNVHPTMYPEDMIVNGGADIVIRGEAEDTLMDVVPALAEGRGLEGIDGISYRAPDGAVVHAPKRTQVRKLDELPFAAWHLFDLEPYATAPMLNVYGISLPIQGSRGCPEQCTFCGQEIFTRKMRYRSIKSILAEIDYLVDNFDIKYFIFADANFPPSKRFGMEFCEAYRQSRHFGKVRWCGELKVNLVDKELLQAMKDAGCFLIEFGIEVGTQKIMDSIRKRTTLEQVRQAVTWAREVGIGSLGLFMIGLPGEGYPEVWETFKFATSLPLDMAKFNIAIPLPGSELFSMYADQLEKDLKPETFSSWHRPKNGGPHITTVPGGLSAEQLVRLQTLFMMGFYLRPKLLTRHLRQRTLTFKDMADGGRFLLGEFVSSLNPLPAMGH